MEKQRVVESGMIAERRHKWAGRPRLRESPQLINISLTNYAT